MAWDDTKQDAVDPNNPAANEQLPPSEWNAHVTDQKARSKTFSGSGSPNGSVTPEKVGDIYVDTSANAAYVATISADTGWEQIDVGASGVASFNGRTGTVVPVDGDYQQIGEGDSYVDVTETGGFGLITVRIDGTDVAYFNPTSITPVSNGSGSIGITGQRWGDAFIDDITFTNTINGITATEFGYLDNVTSNIQTQIDGKISASSSDSLTNKTIDGDSNTISNLDIGNEVDWANATDVSDRTAFASGDKLLIYEAGVGLRKIDYDDLPSGGSSSPLTTKGDLWGYSTVDARLPVGTNDYVLTADSTAALGVAWKSNPAGFADPMTTRGDIIYRDATNTTTRLAAGAVNTVLTSDGTDISWSAASGGGAAATFERTYTGNVATGRLIPISVPDELAGLDIKEVRISLLGLPAGQALKVDVRKSGTATTDSIFTSDVEIEIGTAQSATNDVYTTGCNTSGATVGTPGTTIDSARDTLSADDILWVYVTQVGSTTAGADLLVTISVA